MIDGNGDDVIFEEDRNYDDDDDELDTVDMHIDILAKEIDFKE